MFSAFVLTQLFLHDQLLQKKCTIFTAGKINNTKLTLSVLISQYLLLRWWTRSSNWHRSRDEPPRWWCSPGHMPDCGNHSWCRCCYIHHCSPGYPWRTQYRMWHHVPNPMLPRWYPAGSPLVPKGLWQHTALVYREGIFQFRIQGHC